MKGSMAVLLGALLGALAPAAGAATEEETERVVRAAEGFARDRAPDALRDPVTLRERRTAPRDVVTRGKPLSQALQSHVFFNDAWVYEATAELFYDSDRDGYYRYLRVRFDVDTVHEALWVYAALFLSADGETWEELYVTDDFLVHGTSPDDDYEVETELLQGYPPGEYDLLIELYDADHGLLVDEYGPLESPALALLPLEDAEWDGAVEHDDDGGGGSTTWPFLALLAAAALARRTRPMLP